MTILAFEFSSARRGVAVARDGVVLAEIVHEGSPRTPIFALIGKALERAQVNRGEVDCIAVGLGPGSYTGIRLAISVAQGWRLAKGVRTIGVSSMENLAMVAVGPEGNPERRRLGSLPESDTPLITREDPAADRAALPSSRLAACPTAAGVVLLAVDAQRGEFAVAGAEVGRLVTPIRLLTADELKARLARGEAIAGPEVRQLLGGGFELYPSAAVAACLAAARPEFIPAEQLAPVYLREASFVKAPPARVVKLTKEE